MTKNKKRHALDSAGFVSKEHYFLYSISNVLLRCIVKSASFPSGK
jgi:hypothetical protein